MIITENSKTVMLILTLNIIIQLAVAKKVVVKYFGEDYLVDGGCKAKDETVLKWHKFCSLLHANATLCVTDTFGKNTLTVPKYSNVCDALCHTRINKKFGICPDEKDGKPTPILPANYQVNTAPKSTRVIVSYANSEYLAYTGCPIENKLVQRYYQLCLSTYESRMMCFEDRILNTVIIYPQYTDICSAMCHTELTRNMIFCPEKGRVIGPSPV